MNNMAPINNTQYLQYPSGNAIAFVSQPNLVSGSYIVPIQQNIGVVTKPSLSTNFNTINNNIYNGINNIESINEPISVQTHYMNNHQNVQNNQGNFHHIQMSEDQMTPSLSISHRKEELGLNTPKQNNHNSNSMIKPELQEVYQTTKQLHKDNQKEGS